MNTKRKNNRKSRSDSIFSDLPGVQSESKERMHEAMGGISIGRQMFQTGLHALQNGHLNQATEDFSLALLDFKESKNATLVNETQDMLGGVAAEQAAHSSTHPTMQAVDNSLAANDFLSAATIENGIHSNSINTIANGEYNIARSEWLTLAQTEQAGAHYTKAADSYQQLQSLDSAFGHANKAANDGNLSQAEQFMSSAVHAGNTVLSAQDFDQAAGYFVNGGDGHSANFALTQGAQSWDAASQAASANHLSAQYLDHAAIDWQAVGNTQNYQSDEVKAAGLWDAAGHNAFEQGHLNRALNYYNNSFGDYTHVGQPNKASIEMGNMDLTKGQQAFNGNHFNQAAENYEAAAQAYLTGDAAGAAIANAYEQEGQSWKQAGHMDKAAHSYMKGGAMERNLGNLQAAETDMNQAAQNFSEAQDFAGAAYAYNDLANVEFQQAPGTNNGAVRHWMMAQSLYEQLGENAKEQGNNSLALNLLQNARHVDESALQKLSSVNDQRGDLEAQLARVDSRIAGVYEGEQDWTDAAQYRMLAGNDYVTAAQMAKDTNHQNQMKDYFTEAADQYGINNSTSSTNAFDDFQKAGDYKDALVAYQDAVEAKENE